MSSLRNRLLKFFSLPQNQTGLILLASTIPGYVAQIESHSTTIAIAAGALFAGLMHLVMPGNVALSSDMSRFVSDAVAATEAKNMGAITTILSDAASVAADVTPATAKD